MRLMTIARHLGIFEPAKQIPVTIAENDEDWEFASIYDGERWRISVF